MSERNGDRARFHLARKQKLRRRQRVEAMVKAVRARAEAPSESPAGDQDGKAGAKL